MALIKLLSLFTFLLLAGCNFGDESGADSGGGLFAGHKPAENVTTILPPPNATYVESDAIIFKVSHPFNMTVSGSPIINFDIGGTPVQASYVSGNGSKTLFFSYTVQAGENDSDGIDFTSLDFNGGDITFTHAGGTESITTTVDSPNTNSVYVDTQGPQVVIVVPPSNDTYLVNQELNFLATFDQAVSVSGTPSLELNIGGSTVNATYISGSGTNSLIFRHTVQATDVDNDGIQMNSPLLLTGGSLSDVNGNSATLTYTPTPMPLVLVDGDRPWAQTITYPANNSYTPGQHLDFVLQFTEAVNVTNNPRLSIDVGGVTKFANYLSGTGTDTLTFRYTVVSGDVDSDGIELQNLIDLNTTGTIQDLTAVNADLNLDVVLTPGIIINGILPEVDTITPPVDGTYKLGDVIYFNLNFNTNVDVTGFPILDMELDSSSPGSVDILYNAGSGTNSLVMRYVVQNGDLDQDGITLVSPLDLNSGTIQDVNLTNANLDITTAIAAVDTSNIFIDGVPPTVTSITPPADDDYEAGQNLDFILNFNEAVDVVGGVPSIDLDIGSNVTATYVSGTGTNALTFRYTVQIGDQDLDGIEILANDISLNGATLEDAATNSALLGISGVIPNTTGVTIDGIIPTITSIDVPTFQYYNETDTLQFTVHTSEAVDVTIATPRIAIDIGGSTVYADYQSGGGTTALVFEYTIAAGLEDHDGITLTSPLDANGATIEDSYGNDLDLDFSGVMPDSSGVLVDSLLPTVSSVTPPSDDTYADTENLDFVINFNEAVDVAGGTPYIDINIDGVTRQAQYDSGTGTSALTFRYTIVTDEEDLDGIQFVGNTINLNGATIQDIGGNDIDTDMTVNSALPSLAAVNVEAIHPTITGVTPPADTTYIIGDNLDFIVQFDENVDITNTPRIEITLNSGTVYADYLSGTGTQNITFRYTVAASEEDLDGITLVTPLDLNTSGTILDQWGNTAELPYTPPVTTGILVDGVIPTVTIDTYPNIDFTNEATYTFSGTCSENGELVNVDIGGLTDSPTCTALAWSSTIDTSTLAESADNTVADITITADHADAGGNDAVQASQLVIKDSIIPTVSSNSVNAQVYIIGDSMQVIVNYNEVVTVSGTPRIAVTLDTQASTPIYATYTGGSGSSILSFEYTIQDGDEDNTGTDLNASIDANGGSIVDNLSNETDYSLVTTSFAGAIVDGIRPTISAVNIPSNTYYANDNILVTLTFDDNVTIAGGSPTIPLSFETNVGGPAAVYSSGSTTNSIVFDYPVLAGNEDTNGIDLSTGVVSLGGATIQDANGNDAVLTIPTTNFPTVLVDAIVPTVTINTPLDNIDATNVASYTIDGTCSENGEVVTVNIGGVSATPTCTALAWSTTMDLSAVSESADNTVADVAVTADHDDAGGNSAIQATDTIIKDSIIPTVSSNAITASTYIIGDTVQVQVAFNEAVTVSGTPRIQLNFETEAASPVYANYTAGSGSSNLTFEYTVLAGDEDINGIAGAGSIDLNGGSIVDNLSNETDYNLVSTSYASAFVDGIAPQVTAVAITANTYYATETLTVSVTFDDNITVSGSPEIPLTFDTSVGSPSAVYNAGDGSTTLTFDYLVAAGNEDTNGIDLAAAITLSGGTLQDANGNDSALTLSTTNFPTVLIDAIVPTVTITGPLANINNTNESAYTIDGTCSENGEVVTVNIGGVSATPTCTALAWSTTMDLSAVSESADNTVADVAVTADHDDAGGNSAIQATDTIIKDSIIPTVTSNSIAAGTSAIGDTIQVSVVFNEVVSVTGTPRIELDFETEASGPVYATYSGGDGTNTLTFDYTVLAGDEDTNGIVNVGSIDPNSGSINDNLSNTSDYVLATTANAASFVDGIAPQVTAVAITANTYYATETLTVSVTFDDNITVSGSPEIPLTFDTSVGSPSAVYNAGDGSTTLTFDYLVAAGNEDTNGIDLAAAITLSGGTLQDANGNDSALTLSTTNFPTVLIDAIVPTVTITGPLANINNANESAYTIDGTCSENGEVVTVNIGGVSATPTCTALAWSATMDLTAVAQSADNTVADVAVTADHDDAGGNSAVQATDTIIKDSIIPTVTSNSIAAGTSIIGDTVQVSVVFNEVVNVSGTPRIQLNFETEAASPVYATYSGGDGTNTLTFDYTVLAGDEDTNGIVNVGSIDPNSGSINDNLSNTSDYVLATTANAASFVDGIAPQVTAVAITANTYYFTDTLTVSVTFDDNITVSGSPEIPLTFDTSVGSPSAVYNAGDGSTTLTFDYSVASGNEDTDGIDLAAAITLSGGTLQDANGNDSALALTTTNFPTVLVDAIVPTVAIITPADSSFINIANDSATFTVSGTCSEAGQTVVIKVDGSAAASPSGMLCDGVNFTGTIDTTGLAEGVRAFTAELTDGGGQTGTSTTNNVTKDTIAPTIAISNPADSTYINATTDSATFTVDGTCDESGATVSIEVDASAAASPSGFACDGTNFTGTIDTTGLAEGARSFTAIITDAAGNSTTSTANSVTKDTVLPNIALTTPADSTFILVADDSATYAVSGTCDESGQTVSIEIDASPAASQVGFSCDGTNFAGTIDTTGLSEGVHAFTAIIADTAGNSVTTAANNVTKDTVPPAVAITTPVDSTYINIASDSATYTVSGTCNENGQTVDIRVDGSPAASQSGFVCDGTNFTGTIDTTGISEGALVLTAYLEDAGGNNVTSTGINLTKDTIAPTIAMTTPADSTIIGVADDSATYAVSGTCDENGATVAIELDASAAAGQVGFTCDGTNFAGTIDTTGYADATYAFTAKVSDAAGNETISAANNITKDSLPPTVAITTPADNSFINIASDSATFTVSGTCNEASQTVVIKIDGSAAASPSGFNCDGTNFTGTIDTTGLAEGVRAFTAELTDGGGNTGTSTTNNVTKDTVAPTIAITTSDDVDLSNVTSYSLDGTCDETSGTVNIGFGALTNTATCDGSNWSISGWDVNGAADGPAVSVTADITDAAGNPATQASTTVVKDTTLPNVAITTPANSSYINIASDSATFTVNGTCDENGQTVVIKVDGSAAASPSGFVCDGTNFTGTIDTTGLAEGARSFTAELDDGNGNIGTSGAKSVTKDTVAPTLAITTANDITTANETSYTVSGTCDETSGTVNVNVGATATTASCDGSNWSVTGLDVSANSENPALLITADLSDAAGNPATQATDSVVKDATAPLVAITTPADGSQITVATDSATFAVNGTCNESGQTVIIKIDGSPAASQVGFSCDGTNFSGTIDTTGLATNNTYAFTAELSDAVGNTGVSATNNVTKVQYTVSISSAPAINIANETNYVVSGTCSVDTETVTVTVGGTATNSPTCTGGSFTTSGFDVSGVADNATVSVSADHGSANDSTNVLKDTVAPTLTMGAAPDITATNVTSYSLSGTCDEAGGTVNINLGTISTTASCNGTNWSVSGWNTSAQADGTGISVTADLSDVAGNPATQQTDTLDKDATAPTVTLTTPTNNSFINIASDNASFAVTGTCDDATATFTLKIDGAANGSVTCDGANITGSFDSTALSEAAHTIVIEASDAVGNTGTSATHTITRDVTAPSITSITPPVDGVKLTNDVLSFTVNYNENVTVTGSPTLTQTYNTGGGNAVYASGGGTSALVFNYTVLVTDFDDDGITLVSPLALAGGTMTDTAGNNAILTFTPPTTTGVTINNVHPVFEFYDGAVLITTYDYGDPNANVTVTITIKNVGTAATSTNFGFSVSNGGGVFTIQTDNCTGNVIAINGTCTIDVQYKDKNPAGLKTGTITADDTGYGTNPGFVLNLEGTR